MTERPNPKRDGAGTNRREEQAGANSAGRDKTAVLSPPETGTSVPPASPAEIGGESDRTMVFGDDAQPGEEEGTVLAPPAPGRARLVLRAADGREEEIVLAKPETTIGRSSGCDIVLPAPTVSRIHARILQEAAGCLLIPVGARHNTFVNDEAVSHPRLLHDGDRIQLANEKFVFRFDAGPARPTPAPSRARPMLLGLGGAFAAAALIFFAWRQTTAPPAGPAEQAEPAEAAAVRAEQNALERQAEREAAERVRREEEARLAEQRREEEARLRREEEARETAARVRKYLYEGDVAFLEKRYTTPPEGSAVFAYREALRLDPSNERALDQTAKIIDEYLSWGEDAIARGDRTRARQHYQRAAYVHSEVPSAGDGEAISARLEALRRSLGID